jgi:hypothetical protein
MRRNTRQFSPNSKQKESEHAVDGQLILDSDLGPGGGGRAPGPGKYPLAELHGFHKFVERLCLGFGRSLKGDNNPEITV